MQWLENLQHQINEDESDEDEGLDTLFSTPISPPPFSDIESDEESNSESDFESNGSVERRNIYYRELLYEIWALCDEVRYTCIINHIAELMLWALQLHLLQHFAEFRPDQFRQKVRVDPEIFDYILNQISDHEIFRLKLNHP